MFGQGEKAEIRPFNISGSSHYYCIFITPEVAEGYYPGSERQTKIIRALIDVGLEDQEVEDCTSDLLRYGLIVGMSWCDRITRSEAAAYLNVFGLRTGLNEPFKISKVEMSGCQDLIDQNVWSKISARLGAVERRKRWGL
jgi:hypothetical protein